MPTFERADPDIIAVLDDALERFHPDLLAAGATFSVLVATVDDDSGKPALKNRGYPCLALIRIIGYKDRVKGMNDAEISIDIEKWNTLSPEKQLAGMDHELVHLLLVKEKDSERVKLDKCGRPKLQMRPHDAEVGIFYEVIERHEIHAIEAQTFQQIHKKLSQMTFPWG